jgi:hypothetical protein
VNPENKFAAERQWSSYMGYPILITDLHVRVYLPDATTRVFQSMRRARLAIKRDKRGRA